MTNAQRIYLLATIAIAIGTIIAAAGGWQEITTPATIGALILNVGTVIANYFQPKPQSMNPFASVD